MAYVALLDASVLHPWVLCELLLRLGEHGMYRAAWSESILDEVEASLVRRFPTSEERMKRRREAMQQAFAHAMAPDPARFLPVVPETVDAGDRHVVAAALASRADVIVTHNVRHFPAADLADFGLLVQSPDEFLTHQWRLDPAGIAQAIVQMAGATGRPPLTPDDVLASLATFAATFADAVRDSDEFAAAKRDPDQVGES